MFICTANNKADIDPALLDRMELIEFRDYTLEERTHITTNYLMPKVLSFYKLESFNIVFDPTLIDVLCKNSIQIRQIEKDIAKLLRMAAVKIHVHGSERVIIDSDFSDQVLNKYKSKNKPIGFGGR
jgi:ATP-dependent Lon protease